MKKRNKTYKKRLTKHKKKFYTELALITAVTLAVSIISAVDHNFTIEPVEASLTVYNTPLEVYPPITNNNIKDYVLKEVYLAGLDPNKMERMIGECENKEWNTDAKYKNNDKVKSIDRGLFMINDYWHPEVSNACSYNLECSTKEAIRIIKERGWREWTCGKTLGL